MTASRMRSVYRAAFVGFTVAVAGLAHAADFPTRPIRYVVAFAPGGVNDILARIIGQKLTESWGPAVIVDNRPGAGGNLGAEIVAKSTADGYTILNISTAHTISQTLYPKLNYSLERDLVPVVQLGSSPLIMTINPGIPAKNVGEFVAYAKKNRVIYASGGIGVISHLSMEMFKLAAGIDMTHVPYKGAGPGSAAVIGGEAQLMTNAIPEMLPHAKAGKLRVLGIMAEKRHPFIPDIATFPEQGYKDFVMGNWVGIVAPAGTPKAVVGKMAAEVTRIINSPDVSKRLSDQGFDPIGGTPEQFGKIIRSEVARFGEAVKASGAKAE
jgi:tripartite-type tricarboxylate transporter receptor subunit TctC